MKLRFCLYTLFIGVIFGMLAELHIKQPRLHQPLVRKTGYPIHHQAIEHMKMLTVLISNEGFGGVSRGTGVLVDNMHVLTCAHMIDPGSEMWIYLYPGEVVLRGTVERTGPYDLALIKLNSVLPTPQGGFAQFNEHHGDGQPITVIGNMLGSMKWMVSYGVISTTIPHYLITDALIHGGNSGGPWINEAGEIVALTDWGLQPGETELGVNGGISAQTIDEFLNPKTLNGLGFSLLQFLGGQQ